MLCSKIENNTKLDPVKMETYGVSKRSSITSASKPDYAPARIHPEIKKRYFWGGKLWTQSFFVETIGNANEEVIRKYVQNQLAAMDKIENRVGQLNLF
jgi:REP element-mobilizing transposase RayT